MIPFRHKNRSKYMICLKYFSKNSIYFTFSFFCRRPQRWAFSEFSKSKNTDGQAQLRRPDLTYGSNYTKGFLNDFLGPFYLNLNYKYTGKHIDIDNGRLKMKSTDIINMSLSKNMFGSVFSANISNLLNERYERPATYSKEGRQLRLSFKKIY